VLIAAGRRSVHSMRLSHIIIGSESQLLPTHVHSTPPLGGGFPSEYCCDIWYGKISMVWLPEGERNLKICLFFLTECMYEGDRYTGRETDGHRMTTKDALV